MKTLANGYSSESAQGELSYEYQQDKVWMIFRNLSILVIWTQVASALEGLTRADHAWDELRNNWFPMLYTILIHSHIS